jgi:hypothetical protein
MLNAIHANDEPKRLKETRTSVLNANYIARKLKDTRGSTYSLGEAAYARGGPQRPEA